MKFYVLYLTLNIVYSTFDYRTGRKIRGDKISFCPHTLKGARTLRPRIFAEAVIYAKLFVVQLSSLHKTLKSWTTSTHPKNHEDIDATS